MNGAWWFALGGLLIGLAAGAALAGAFKRRDSTPKKSREADNPELLNQLARELVHEIRNPLNSIYLHLQFLEEDLAERNSAPDDLRQRVSRVRSEVERLNRLLTDFRRYAKLPPLTLAACDLGLLINEVLDFSEPEAQRQNVEVIRDIHPLPPVVLDRGQFKQALLNLIVNANQAMEKGGKLTVRARPLNGKVRIDVEDTGPGVEPDEIDKIFELFFSTKADGAGVGLAIVKKVVEGHGGHIRVESQPGLGATFSIFLPVNPVRR
jgi:signal transduction histidine kinase